tara:strand:+ start:1020 stop:1850 length:831 start_codon:yes stop_codon:yes gene_type:complete
MFLAMITWAMAWTNAHIVNTYLSFYNLVFFRFLLGSISLLPIIIFQKNKINFSWNIIKYVFPASILFLFYNISFFMATENPGVGRGAVLVTTINPIITLLIMIAIKRIIKLKEIAGIALGILGGLIIMNVFTDGLGVIFHKNNIYFLICALTWGIMTVVVNYGQKKILPLQFIFYCYTLTTILAFPLTDITVIDFNSWDISFYVNFLLVSVGAMSFGTSIYMYFTSVIGPVKSSVFIFSVPFLALAISSVFLEEIINIRTVVGGLLSLIAIYVVNK